MSTDIRLMTSEDYDQVYALWESVEGVGLHDYEDSREGISAFLDRNPSICFVATCDDSIVGAVLCGHDSRRGYLQHLAVQPDQRGQGIGQMLVDACLEGLKALNIRKCTIMVFGDNDTGLEFWRNRGWKTRDDMIIMQMPVGRPIASAEV